MIEIEIEKASGLLTSCSSFIIDIESDPGAPMSGLNTYSFRK